MLGYVCDWPKHRRSVHKTDSSGDIGCCDTPSGDQCNWMTCPDCFLLGTYDLQATHQYMSKMVSSSCYFFIYFPDGVLDTLQLVDIFQLPQLCCYVDSSEKIGTHIYLILRQHWSSEIRNSGCALFTIAIAFKLTSPGDTR